MDKIFTAIASRIAWFAGQPAAFIIAVSLIVIWGVTGPVFHYSDTWQLIVNTATTIVTFLMVFLIQHTQNRDTAALQLKLDELIIATHNARNAFAAIEEQSEESLKAAKEDIRARAERASSAEDAKLRAGSPGRNR